MKEVNFFKKKGYYKIKVLDKIEIKKIIEVIVNRLNVLAKKKIFNSKNIINIDKFNLDKDIYKKIVNSSTRFITLKSKQISKIKKNKDFLKILNGYWQHSNIKIIWVGDPDKKELKFNKIGFRIARPLKKKDAALPHIDSYNKDKKSFVSLWIPLVGFNKKYTCRFFPGTHNLNHKKKYFKKNTNYISKVFSNNYLKHFSSFRPNLKSGEAILFHPNLIHGGSDNLGTKTRLSIEFRIFNKNRYNLKTSFNRNFKSIN